MSKTVDLQIEKSKELIAGYRKNLTELKGKGVTAEALDKMETELSTLKKLSVDCDATREALSAKVQRVNETLERVKNDFLETKKVVRNNYPQEQWIKFGIQDKR